MQRTEQTCSSKGNAVCVCVSEIHHMKEEAETMNQTRQLWTFINSYGLNGICDPRLSSLARSHTHTLSLSLSLSLTHTHTHTHVNPTRETHKEVILQEPLKLSSKITFI